MTDTADDLAEAVRSIITYEKTGAPRGVRLGHYQQRAEEVPGPAAPGRTPNQSCA